MTPYCLDCPDHEACSTGYPCKVVKKAAEQVDTRECGWLGCGRAECEPVCAGLPR